MKVTIESRSGRVLLKDLQVEKSATVAQLKKLIHIKVKKLYPNRQRLVFQEKVLEDESKVSTAGITDGSTIVAKDLGPQIGWRTVFLIEYVGPLIIHPLFYFYPQYFYSSVTPKTWTQFLALLLVLLHYFKREYESLFVHRFSHGTMPFRNLFKNCFHYWILSGVNLAYWIYAPSEYEAGFLLTCLSLSLFIFGEISNFYTHANLANLRPPGTKVRKIPYGFGFDFVSCPNYFFELVAWVAFSLLTHSVAAYFFFAVSAGQIWLWSLKKHKQYKKDFKEYPRKRKVLIPFLL